MAEEVTARDAHYRQEWSEIQEVERLEKQLEEAKRRVALLPRRHVRQS